jgi:hypothetical protein
MWFLRSSNQHRSTFHRGRDVTVSDRQAIVVEFKESAKPRLIATNNDAPAHGQFWIDVETGRGAPQRARADERSRRAARRRDDHR